MGNRFKRFRDMWVIGGHGMACWLRSMSIWNRSTRWCWSCSVAWSRFLHDHEILVAEVDRPTIKTVARSGILTRPMPFQQPGWPTARWWARLGGAAATLSCPDDVGLLGALRLRPELVCCIWVAGGHPDLGCQTVFNVEHQHIVDFEPVVSPGGGDLLQGYTVLVVGKHRVYVLHD